MVDSVDRNATTYPLANNFQISKPQALLNGFFHRIGTTEVVLEWTTPNISAALGNNVIAFDLSGNTSGTITDSITLLDGFYTAYDIANLIAPLLTVEAAAAPLVPLPVFAAVANPSGLGGNITATNDVWVRFHPGFIQSALGLTTTYVNYNNLNPIPIQQSDLRGIRYLDFVSAQLTYNQDLKDSSTNVAVRDVLCRWYMAYDQPAPQDAWGLPIEMGMSPFVLRRIFSPPKQIRWDNIQPIGSIAFEVYRDAGATGNPYALAPFTDTTNWLMTLQVSEN
jgi:hypothetical protein